MFEVSRKHQQNKVESTKSKSAFNVDNLRLTMILGNLCYVAKKNTNNNLKTMWLGYPVNHEAPRGDTLLFLHPQAHREPPHDQHPHRHEQDGDDDVNPQDRVSCI